MAAFKRRVPTYVRADLVVGLGDKKACEAAESGSLVARYARCSLPMLARGVESAHDDGLGEREMAVCDD